MTRPLPISKPDLHQLLFDRSGRARKLQLNQKELAKELGIPHDALNRVVKQIEAEGRIKKIGARKDNIGVYAVKDPDEFRTPE